MTNKNLTYKHLKSWYAVKDSNELDKCIVNLVFNDNIEAWYDIQDYLEQEFCNEACTHVFKIIDNETKQILFDSREVS